MQPITFDKGLIEPAPTGTVSGGASGHEGGFGKMLDEAVQSVNRSQRQAETAIAELITGRGDIHQTLIAMEKADVSFQLVMQVRNKLVAAYEEMMRMQV